MTMRRAPSAVGERGAAVAVLVDHTLDAAQGAGAVVEDGDATTPAGDDGDALVQPARLTV